MRLLLIWFCQNHKSAPNPLFFNLGTQKFAWTCIWHIDFRTTWKKRTKTLPAPTSGCRVIHPPLVKVSAIQRPVNQGLRKACCELVKEVLTFWGHWLCPELAAHWGSRTSGSLSVETYYPEKNFKHFHS